MSSTNMTIEMNGVRSILIIPIKMQISVPGTLVQVSARSHVVYYRNMGSNVTTKITL